MELMMDYDKTVALGSEAILKFLDAMFPHYKLYSLSEGWLKSRQYIAKAKGAYGDIVIRWM